MERITYSRMYCKRDFVQTADNLLKIFMILFLWNIYYLRDDKANYVHFEESNSKQLMINLSFKELKKEVN